MARGTDYSIYKITDESVELDKDLVLSNIKEVHCFLRPDANWENDVYDVFPMWYNFEKYVADEKTHMFTPSEEYDGKYVRKSDGRILERVACWTFNSMSLPIMNDIFEIYNNPTEYILSDRIVNDFIDAVDFIDRFSSDKYVKDKALISFMARNNRILNNFIENGYMPLKERSDEDSDGSEMIVLGIRDILKTYQTLCNSDMPYRISGNEVFSEERYLLTIGYYG